MQRRAILSGIGLGQRANSGDVLLTQLVPVANATAGNVTLTAQEILSGWIQRSNGGGAAFTDTWPSADSIILGMSDCQVGDCFQLWYQNTVAFLSTFAAGTGIISGTGTLNVAASTTRLYMCTILANKPQKILVGNNTNASAILTGFTAADLASIMPGMGVTGANVPASTTVLGVTPGDGTNDPSTGGKVTMSANATGTNAAISFTFFPRIRVDGLGTLAA